LALGAFTIKENAWQLFDGGKILLMIFREHLVKVLRALLIKGAALLGNHFKIETPSTLYRTTFKLKPHTIITGELFGEHCF